MAITQAFRPDDALEYAMASDVPAAEKINVLIDQVQASGASTAFQSVAVAAAQALERALKHSRQLAEAAISMAQQQKLEVMIEELAQTAEALHPGISEQGLRLLQAPPAHKTFALSTLIGDKHASKLIRLVRERWPAKQDEERSWWFSLSEAIYLLGDDADWIESIVSGQPEGTPARTLAETIAGLLRRHHEQLLVEAERWLS